MSNAAPDRSWLLLFLLALLFPLALGAAPLDPTHGGLDVSVVFAGDDEEDDESPAGEEDEDPFSDDSDSFDSPTSFTPEQAEKAIIRGVTWLKTHQLDDGSWGPVVGNQAYGGGPMQGQGYTHPAGSTALALYALLKCKTSTRDPVVKKGFAFLKKRHEKPGGSYEASAMLLAMCATANPYKTSRASRRQAPRMKLAARFRHWAQILQRHLLEKRSGQGWRYNVSGGQGAAGGSQDLSSTQLAALALFAAHQLGIRAPESVWEDILDFSMAQQDDTGNEVISKDPLTGKEIRRQARGFAYIKGQEHPEEGQATGSMTACGVANIMMARFVLTDGGRKREEWDNRANAAKVQSSVEDGLAWLEENWSAFSNPRKAQMNVYHIYWLYAVERAMDLVGNHKLGPHFWYSEMGQQLLDRQKEDGSWDSQSTHEPRGVLDTSFALLFLKRATQGSIPFPSFTGGSDEPPVDNR